MQGNDGPTGAAGMQGNDGPTGPSGSLSGLTEGQVIVSFNSTTVESTPSLTVTSNTYNSIPYPVISTDGNTILAIGGSSCINYFSPTITAVPYQYTLSVSDNNVGIDTSSHEVTVYLPASSIGIPLGISYTIFDKSGNAIDLPISINAGEGDTIYGYNGGNGYSINTNYGSVTIIYTGSTEWHIISTGNSIGGLSLNSMLVSNDNGTGIATNPIVTVYPPDSGNNNQPTISQVSIVGDLAVENNIAVSYQGNNTNSSAITTGLLLNSTVNGINASANTEYYNTYMLPPCNTVPIGSIYIIKDELGYAKTNNITINANNLDGNNDRINGNLSSIQIKEDYGQVILYNSRSGSGNTNATWFNLLPEKPYSGNLSTGHLLYATEYNTSDTTGALEIDGDNINVWNPILLKSSVEYNYQLVNTTPVQLLLNAYIVAVDTATPETNITITLPSSPSQGQIIIIKKIAGDNSVTVLGGNEGVNIEGSSSSTINSANGSLQLFFDGSNWWIC